MQQVSISFILFPVTFRGACTHIQLNIFGVQRMHRVGPENNVAYRFLQPRTKLFLRSAAVFFCRFRIPPPKVFEDRKLLFRLPANKNNLCDNTRIHVNETLKNQQTLHG